MLNKLENPCNAEPLSNVDPLMRGWATGDGFSVQRTINVTVGKFALDSLGGASTGSAALLSRSLEQAIRYYLADRGSERAGWVYPSFLREDAHGSAREEVRLTIETAAWSEFTDEAERQGVSADQLLRHAVLYFMTDRDTGRLTQRILEDLGREEEL
jgi:hypothetical protein